MALHQTPSPKNQADVSLEASLPVATTDRTIQGEYLGINPQMIGYRCYPPGYTPETSFNTVLVLGGSDGGIWKEEVERWARRGYIALGVAYHQGAEHSSRRDWGEVPHHLHSVELTGFKDALDLLTGTQGSTRKVAIIGVSRGGELAFILGALYPERIDAIVAIVPAASSNIAHSQNKEIANNFVSTRSPAWCLGGVPYRGATDDSRYVSQYTLGRIPVENIRAPLFVVSGGRDIIWGSEVYKFPHLFNAEEIVRKRNDPRDVAKHYPDSGHFFFDPKDLDLIDEALKNNPEGHKKHILGGGGLSVEAVYEASRDYFKALETFIGEHFPGGPVA